MKIKDGKLDDTEKLVENIKTEWAGFIIASRTDGANVENPPSDNPSGENKDLGSMSMEDYIAARKKM